MSCSDISAPRMEGTASCAPKGVHTKQPITEDIGPPAIGSLMDIKVTPPVPSNPNRELKSNDNKRVLDPTSTAIPSLMSLETRPPWETRLTLNSETR